MPFTARPSARSIAASALAFSLIALPAAPALATAPSVVEGLGCEPWQTTSPVTGDHEVDTAGTMDLSVAVRGPWLRNPATASNIQVGDTAAVSLCSREGTAVDYVWTFYDAHDRQLGTASGSRAEMKPGANRATIAATVHFADGSTVRREDYANIAPALVDPGSVKLVSSAGPGKRVVFEWQGKGDYPVRPDLFDVFVTAQDDPYWQTVASVTDEGNGRFSVIANKLWADQRVQFHITPKFSPEAGPMKGFNVEGRATPLTFRTPAGDYPASSVPSAVAGSPKILPFRATSVVLERGWKPMAGVPGGTVALSGLRIQAGDKVLVSGIRDGVGGVSFTLPAALAGQPVTATMSYEVRLNGYLAGGATKTVTWTSLKEAFSTGSLDIGSTRNNRVGSAKVGQRVYANPGGYGAVPGEKRSFRWAVNGKTVPGAGSSSFVIPASAVGKKVTVSILRSAVGYTSKTVTSSAVKVVAAKGRVGTVSASGTARPGKTLAATTKNWTPGAKLTYRWYRNGAPIARATGSRYKVTKLDAGRKVSVRVTAQRLGYTTVAKTSPVRWVAKR